MDKELERRIQNSIEDFLAGVGVGLFVGLTLYLVWCAITPGNGP
jgi:hypothetical protein